MRIRNEVPRAQRQQVDERPQKQAAAEQPRKKKPEIDFDGSSFEAAPKKKGKGSPKQASKPAGPAARVNWSSPAAVDGVIEHGRSNKAWTGKFEQEANRAAEALTGTTWKGPERANPAKELSAEAFAQLLAEKFPSGTLDPAQIAEALQYVNSAGSAGEQRDRVVKALWAFQTAATVGTGAPAAAGEAGAVGEAGATDVAAELPGGLPTADYENVQVKIPGPAEYKEHIPEAWKTHKDFSGRGAEFAPPQPANREGGEKIKIRWNDEHVDNVGQYGLKTGAVTPEIDNDIHNVARAMTEVTPENRSGPIKKQVAPEELAKALVARIPPDRLDPAQFLGAVQYINSASNAGQQHDRVVMTMRAFQAMDKAGGPPMSRIQMEADLYWNSKVDWHVTQKSSVTSVRDMHNRVLEATYTPGDHKVKLAKDRTVEVKVDEQGKTTKLHVDHRDTWDKIGDVAKKVVPIALTVMSFIPVTAPFAIAANAALSAYNAAKAIKNGNWLGAVAGIAGAVAGGAGAIAAKVGSAAAATANTVAKVADNVAKIAGGVQGALDAYKNKNWGSFLGSVAGVAAGAAGFVANGASNIAQGLNNFAKWADRGSVAINAYDAAKNGDVLGALQLGAALGADIAADRKQAKLDKAVSGAMNGTTTPEQLREILGDASAAAKWEKRFGNLAVAAHAGRAVEGAIDSKDYFGAAATVAEYLSGVKKLSPRAAHNLEVAAKVFNAAGFVERSLEAKDYLGAAAIATSLAGELTGKKGFEWAGSLLGDASVLKQAIDSGDKGAIARAAWQLAKGVKGVVDEVKASRVKPELGGTSDEVEPQAEAPNGAEEPVATDAPEAPQAPEGPGEVEDPSDPADAWTSYTVRSGDTLARIARQVYGDESKWPLIYDANAAGIGRNPHLIRVGATLDIPPASATLSPAREKAIRELARAHAPQPKPKDPVSGGEPIEPTPEPSNDAGRALTIRASQRMLEHAELLLREQPRHSMIGGWDQEFLEKQQAVREAALQLRLVYNEVTGAVKNPSRSVEQAYALLRERDNRLNAAIQDFSQVLNRYSDSDQRVLERWITGLRVARFGADVLTGLNPIVGVPYQAITGGIDKYVQSGSFGQALAMGLTKGATAFGLARLGGALKAAKVDELGQRVITSFGSVIAKSLNGAGDELTTLAGRVSRGEITFEQATRELGRVRDRALSEAHREAVKKVAGMGFEAMARGVAGDALDGLTRSTSDAIFKVLVRSLEQKMKGMRYAA